MQLNFLIDDTGHLIFHLLKIMIFSLQSALMFLNKLLCLNIHLFEMILGYLLILKFSFQLQIIVFPHQLTIFLCFLIINFKQFMFNFIVNQPVQILWKMNMKLFNKQFFILRYSLKNIRLFLHKFEKLILIHSNPFFNQVHTF